MNDFDPLLCSFIDGDREDRNHNCCVCVWRDEQFKNSQYRNPKTVRRLVHLIANRIENVQKRHFALILISLFLGARFRVQVTAEAESESVVFDSRYKSHVTLFISLVVSVICVSMFVNTINASNFADEFSKEDLISIRQKVMRSIDKEERQQRENHYGHILSLAIQCKTVSYDDKELNRERNNELVRLHGILKQNFPLIHKLYPPQKINNFSLLFQIPGLCQEKKPIMLCSHLDVVPAPDDNTWTHDAFAGKIVENVVWGRGSIDNKHNVVSQLGAIEELLRDSKRPHRTVILAIGHDEEIGGHDGAKYMARYLKELNYTFEYILDEGTMMVSGAIPGTKRNVALIGITEKGSMNLELSVQGSGGHSSLPPINEENPIKVMSKAIVALESNPHLAHFNPGSPFRTSLEYISGKLCFPYNVMFSNIWLFKKMLMALLIRSSSGVAASMRTTTAVTKIQGGEKINALPSNVKAFVNHRVHPLDYLHNVIDYVRSTIGDDRVHIRVLDSFPAAPISDYRSSSFKSISKCVKAVFDFDSTPSLMVGNTDTRWYWNLSENIYRFSPLPLTLQETKMFHGVNEKISLKDLTNMVDFYKAIILFAE